MKKYGLATLFVVILVLTLSCGDEYDPDRKAENINRLRQELQQTPSEQKGTDAYLDSVGKMVARYHTFADNHPGHPESPGYIYHAAMLQAETLGDFEGSIASLQYLVDTWPEHERAPFALFLIGYTATQYLHDYDRAEEAYEQFLDSYPDHELAESIAHEIENLGKHPFEYDFWEHVDP